MPLCIWDQSSDNLCIAGPPLSNKSAAARNKPNRLANNSHRRADAADPGPAYRNKQLRSAYKEPGHLFIAVVGKRIPAHQAAPPVPDHPNHR